MRFHLRRIVTFIAGILLIACLIYGIQQITYDKSTTPKRNPQKTAWLDTKLSNDENKFAVGGSHLLQKIKSRVNSEEMYEHMHYDNNKENLLQVPHKNMGNLRFDVNDEKGPQDIPKVVIDDHVLGGYKALSDEFRKIHDENKEPQNEKSKGHIEKNDNQQANNEQLVDFDNFPEPNYNVHVFYYAWYGNPAHDGKYYHWNHPRLPHWDKKVAAKYSTDEHVPPDDIGANFYPELGPYSSRDRGVIDDHMRQIRTSGAGVLAVSWYPPGLSDDNGTPWDSLMPSLLDAAEKHRLKICFHIEPFKGRSADTVRQWIGYIIDTYGNHPAFYRYKGPNGELPLYYLYDSYQVSNDEWQQLFSKAGANTVRDTRLDGYFIGLLVDKAHQKQLTLAGFDGYYTYFASDGFSYGSSTINWKLIMTQAIKENKIFIPSVGPGYIDDRVRPWNKQNTKDRKAGRYYENSFLAALGCSAEIISITSFNEWHEGTQIEKAVPYQDGAFKYLDYAPNKPDFYLQLTKKWIDKFKEKYVN